MKKIGIAVFAVCVAGLAHAQVPGTKPGLWETRIVKQVVDGKDMTAQINGAIAQLANLPPEQRAMIESHMKGSGFGGGGMRVCISPAMAAKHELSGDPHSHCPPASTEVSGNTISFVVNCTYEGRTTVGKGQAVLNGDSYAIHSDVKETDSKGSHTAVSDIQMTYLGSDCQGIKPMDQK